VIVGIVGKQGRGKTLLMTALGYIASRYGSFYLRYLIAKEHYNVFNHKTIYANYKLKFPFNPVGSIEAMDDMKKGTALLDELYLWCDSRASMSGVNKAVNNIAHAARKKEMDILYTSHSWGKVDKRIRHITDLILAPDIDIRTGVITVNVIDAVENTCKILNKFKLSGSLFFNMYDTTEEVAEIEKPSEEDND
jgi:hypothetical protein